MDGCFKGNPGRAASRGVLKDSIAKCLDRFALNLGWCTSVMVESQALFYDLRVVWDFDCRRVLMELDSLMVLQYLSSSLDSHHPYYPIFQHIYQLFVRDQIVQVKQIYREGNTTANLVANFALNMFLGFHTLDHPSSGVLKILFHNINGVCLSQAVKNFVIHE